MCQARIGWSKKHILRQRLTQFDFLINKIESTSANRLRSLFIYFLFFIFFGERIDCGLDGV